LRKRPGWWDKQLSDDDNDCKCICEHLRQCFCAQFSPRELQAAGVHHAARFQVNVQKRTYRITDVLQPRVSYCMTTEHLLWNEWDMAAILSRATLEMERSGEDSEGDAPNTTLDDVTCSGIKDALEKHFGPEEVLVHEQKPSLRFMVRPHEEGIRIFDSLHADFFLFVAREELAKKGLNIKQLYKRND
jgi:hypothetical protein